LGWIDLENLFGFEFSEAEKEFFSHILKIHMTVNRKCALMGNKAFFGAQSRLVHKSIF